MSAVQLYLSLRKACTAQTPVNETTDVGSHQSRYHTVQTLQLGRSEYKAFICTSPGHMDCLKVRGDAFQAPKRLSIGA